MNAKRRTTLAAIACTALRPLAAWPRTPRRLAIVHFGSPADWTQFTVPFLRALEENGFRDGREVEVHLVGLSVKPDGGPEDVVPLIERDVLPLRPDAIVTTGPAVTHCLYLATKTVPIVTHVPNPVEQGWARSLAKPGGNITGLTDAADETSAKIVELVRQLVPSARRLAVYSDARPGAKKFAGHYERAARAAGLEPVLIASKDSGALLASMAGLRATAIHAAIWATATGHPAKAASAALAARVPLFATDEHSVRVGALASYEGYEPDVERRIAGLAAQVLRGTRPGDIPFQLPQRFRLAINRRTADALGIAVPQDLLLRADEVFG
jgi:putative ABC transport system substrate-binding protein